MYRLLVSLMKSLIWLFFQLMFYSSVFIEICLPSCLKFTLVTHIFNIFVFILWVDLEMCLLCCLVFTQVTGILYTIVGRLHNSLMCTTRVIQQTILTFKHCLTFFALIQRLFQEVRLKFVKLFCFPIQLLARLKIITAMVECPDI